MTRWERLKAGTIADTEVLKAIVKRAFLKSAENVADLWVRDDRAFIKIRGFRESFKPGNIFQVKLADEALQYRVPKSVEYNLEGIQRITWDWVKWIEKLEKHLAEQKESGGDGR